MSEPVRTLPARLDADERPGYRPDTDARAAELTRSNGPTPTLDVLDSLMAEVRFKTAGGEWDDRAQSDGWLAPRIHYSLRLYRAEAADRGLWQWVALRYPWYVHWRWADQYGKVAEDRWWGPVHKQTFARLWWGAETFRDGYDYRSVVQAFVFQDFPNSYLHRPIVRCRSLALAIIDRIATSDSASAGQVNDLARVLNLATVGTPPEVETNYQVDDYVAFEGWCLSAPSLPKSWESLPSGPQAVDTTVDSLQGAARIVSRGWRYASLD